MTHYKSLFDHISDLLELKPRTPEFYQAFVFTLEHVCLQTSIKEFHDNLSTVVNFKKLKSGLTASKFRLTISKSGYAILRLRFYSVYMCLTRGASSEDFDYWQHQYSIDRKDRVLLERLHKQRFSGPSLKTKVGKKFKQKEMFSAASVENVITEFGIMLPDVKRFIKMVINKRLRFILRTYNMTRDEFVSELMFSAVKAHYKSKPNDYSLEKSTNIVRRSIDNAAVNIINAYTTTKRERLINEGQDSQGHNVFTLRVVSENQMRLKDMSGEDLDLSYDSMFSSALRIKEEKLKDIDFSVDQLIRKFGYRSRRGRLLTAFFKQDCVRFNRWLVTNKYLRSETKTTQEFMDSKTREEFIKILAVYLDTTPAQITDKALPSMARALALI